MVKDLRGWYAAECPNGLGDLASDHQISLSFCIHVQSSWQTTLADWQPHNQLTSLSGYCVCQVPVCRHHCAWLWPDFDWLCGLEVFCKQLLNHHFPYLSFKEQRTAPRNTSWTILRCHALSHLCVSFLFLSLDSEYSCGFSVRYMRSVIHLQTTGVPECAPLATIQSHSVCRLLKPVIKSHCRRVSHGNLDSVDTYCREQALGRQPTWLLSVNASERECVFYGFGKDHNWGVCVLWGWLEASDIVLALQTEQELKTHTNTEVPGFPLSGGQTKRLSHDLLCGAPQKRKVLCSVCSFPSTSFSLHPPFFSFLFFSPDLQMNWTLCSDVASRLPNEVSNYEACYFQCNAGCGVRKEGV